MIERRFHVSTENIVIPHPDDCELSPEDRENLSRTVMFQTSTKYDKTLPNEIRKVLDENNLGAKLTPYELPKDKQ